MHLEGKVGVRISKLAPGEKQKHTESEPEHLPQSEGRLGIFLGTHPEART